MIAKISRGTSIIRLVRYLFSPGRYNVCQPVGQRAWDDAHPRIACRSAAAHAPSGGEELAWFDRHEVELQAKQTQSFEEWYGPFDR